MNENKVTSIALGLGGLALAGSLIGNFIWGLPAFFLFLAGGVLCICIVLMWGSLQQMGDPGEMSFEQALSFAAPSAAEEQKRALLRTLKDLEYELSVGKISREDYDQVSADIRLRARQVIAQTDETMKDRLAAAEARARQHVLAKKTVASDPTDGVEEEEEPAKEEIPASDDGDEESQLTDEKEATSEEMK